MQRTIPLFKPVFDTPSILRRLEKVLNSGWTGYGPESLAFEKEFCSYLGFPHSHFLNSATAGLHLALECVKSKLNPYLHDYERIPIVATTPLTFVSTNHVIKYMKWIYDFIDIEEDSLCMDPKLLESEIRRGTKYAAVIFVGIGGNVGGLKKIAEICKGANVPLILDASHMAGTYFVEPYSHAGVREADYIVFSFQAVKNLPTADSGMICCKDWVDDDLVRKLSWLGIDKNTHERTIEGGNWFYNVPYVGYKYQGNDIMAAIARDQLDILDADNSIRRMQADEYLRGLPKFFIPHSKDCISSRHLAQIRVPELRRHGLISHCRDKGVILGVHYRNNAEYPMYNDQLTLCKVADRVSHELVSLPIGPHLREEDVSKVIEVIYEYFA